MAGVICNKYDKEPHDGFAARCRLFVVNPDYVDPVMIACGFIYNDDFCHIPELGGNTLIRPRFMCNPAQCEFYHEDYDQ